MAKQIGVFKIKGKIGDFSFYKNENGEELVRLKGGIDANRIKTDPAFIRTRENGQEFGRAAKLGSLIRSSLRSIVQRARDSRMSSRLHQSMMAVLQSDTVNPRGQRDVINGNLNLLNGFEFNKNAPLGSTVYFQFGVSLDRTLGEVSVSLPALVPSNEIKWPTGATHYNIIAGASEVNWTDKSYVSQGSESGWLPIDNSSTTASSMVLSLTPNSADTVLGVFGIEFGQEVNGQVYVLRNGAYNALSMVLADKI